MIRPPARCREAGCTTTGPGLIQIALTDDWPRVQRRRTFMRLRTGFAAVGILLGLALLSACSGKSDNSTTGPPPGGGLELNSGNIGSGGTFPHTFMTAGTFGYHCTIHSGMTGSVT